MISLGDFSATFLLTEEEVKCGKFGNSARIVFHSLFTHSA